LSLTYLEPAVIHAFHQVERPRPELHVVVALLLALAIVMATTIVGVVVPAAMEAIVVVGMCNRCKQRCRGEQRRECAEGIAHGTLLSSE
jgi:hypothetical protein